MLTKRVAPSDLAPNLHVVLRSTQIRLAKCILSLSTCDHHRRAGRIAGTMSYIGASMLR